MFLHRVVFGGTQYFAILASSKFVTTTVVAEKMELVEQTKVEVVRMLALVSIEVTNTLVMFREAYMDFKVVILKRSCFAGATTRFLGVV